MRFILWRDSRNTFVVEKPTRSLVTSILVVATLIQLPSLFLSATAKNFELRKSWVRLQKQLTYGT